MNTTVNERRALSALKFKACYVRYTVYIYMHRTCDVLSQNPIFTYVRYTEHMNSRDISSKLLMPNFDFFLSIITGDLLKWEVCVKPKL